MNKMIKGAAFAGVGVALLLGGGGTLANWNVEKEAPAGTIISGDLDLAAPQGSWTSSKGGGEIIKIEEYKVVPGETLTYTQDLTLTIEGDQLAARLEVGGVPTLGSYVTLTGPVLTNTAGDVLPTTVLDANSPDQVRATATFAFNQNAVGRQGANETFDLSKVKYTLTQVTGTNN